VCRAEPISTHTIGTALANPIRHAAVGRCEPRRIGNGLSLITKRRLRGAVIVTMTNTRPLQRALSNDGVEL
jgi:hypothetical protein